MASDQSAEDPAAIHGIDAPEPRKSGEGAPSAQASAFQAALGAWRNVDLTNLQKSLDTTASEIVNGQRDSLVERKELAQKTKEYRKLDEEAKKEEWKSLLKSYQTFIDHLTTSKKSTETAFLSLYSTLSEAPDPYPLLEATIDSLVNYSEMQVMTKDNASLNATVNRLTSQISRLEASINAKNKELEQNEQEREEEVRKAEEVWKGVLDEKSRNWEAKEKALQEKIEHQEGVLKEMKASYEVAQKMKGMTSGAEEDFLGKERSAELEIVTRDLERTTLRLAEVEGRNEQLRLELEKASSQDHADITTHQNKPSDEDDSTILRLQQENASLLQKVDNAKADVETQKKTFERKLRSVERTVEGLEKDKDALKEKLARWFDYDDIKRELEILKSIEFATGEDDDDDNMLDFSKAATPASSANSDKETLEQLLLARNKKLGNELTVLRVSHHDLTTRLETLQRTLDTTVAELTTARTLNQKLEDDLLKFQHETAAHHSSALSVAGTYVSRYPPSQRTRISPTSSIIGGHSPMSAIEPPTLNPGILPMITAQRDRFKTRNAELETELAQSNATISNLRSEVASLQKDNMSLYEKTRFVSNYATNRSTGYSSTGGNSNVSIDRYRQAYESNISPFEAFRGRETARAYRRMSIPERIVYSFTRVILANRVSRNLFAGYCVLLHLLVFCMLYYAGTTDVDRGVAGMAAGAAATVDPGSTEALPGDWTQESFDGRT